MSVIGLRVGPFEIAEIASVPEEGSWYIARRTGLTTRQPQEVLVKLLRPDATNPERVSLQSEFETLRTLDDSRVPAPVAYYEGTGALAITAVRGTPLSAMLEDRRQGGLPMTPATLLDLALELVEVLQHAHLRGRHHGHLTARSVLLAPDGRLWTFGFGPGPEVVPPEPWQAPERARGEATTPATDQWSLGALIASLVTGHPPWRGDEPEREALRGTPDAAIGPAEEQWPALGRLLRRLMDPAPANRFPSMSPVRQEVLALARKAGGTSDRRELGALLHERHAQAPPAEPAPAVEEVPDLEEEATEPQQTDPGDDPTVSVTPPEPPPSETEQASAQPTAEPTAQPTAEAEAVVDSPPPRRRLLPREPMPVVRPDLSTQMPDLPTARLGTDDALERAPTELAEPLDPLEHAPTEMMEPTADTTEDDAPAPASADLEPSVSAAVRLVLPAGALAGVDDLDDLEATLVIDTRELLEAAAAAAEARDPASAVPRGDARLVLDPSAGERNGDEITATFGARIHLDATALLEAAGGAVDLDEATVVIDAHGLADILASAREADEATVLLDGSAVVRALVEAARRGQAEQTDEGEPEATLVLDAVAEAAVLVAEVQLEPTDPGAVEAVVEVVPTDPGHPQVDDGEVPQRPKPHGHHTAITVVPPSDPLGDEIGEHITEDDIPFHDQYEVAREAAEQAAAAAPATPQVAEGAPSPIMKVAPWLVVVMVGLMLLFALWQLVT